MGYSERESPQSGVLPRVGAVVRVRHIVGVVVRDGRKVIWQRVVLLGGSPRKLIGPSQQPHRPGDAIMAPALLRLLVPQEEGDLPVQRLIGRSDVHSSMVREYTWVRVLARACSLLINVTLVANLAPTRAGVLPSELPLSAPWSSSHDVLLLSGNRVRVALPEGEGQAGRSFGVLRQPPKGVMVRFRLLLPSTAKVRKYNISVTL